MSLMQASCCQQATSSSRCMALPGIPVLKVHVDGQPVVVGGWQPSWACLPTRGARSSLCSPQRRMQPVTAPAASAASAAAAAAPMVTDGWALWALVAGGGALAQVAAKRTRWGQALSSPLVAMSLGIALAASGVLPCDCPAFDVVWQFLMPAAAACYLLETDVVQLFAVGGPTLVAFLVGAVTMVVGAVASYAVLRSHMGQHGAQIAACLCASYVGGSVNFASVQKAIGLPAGLVPACMAADNICMAFFLAALAAVPTPPAADSTQPSSSGSGGCSTKQPSQLQPQEGLTSEGAALILGTAAVACAIGKKIAAALGMPNLYLMFMAVAAAALGSIISRLISYQAAPAAAAQPQPSMFTGASQLASALMSMFFIIIGCSAGSLASLANPQSLAIVLFLVVMVIVHWVLLWLANCLLRLPIPALVLGSNANVGGPATAAAMAASKGWAALLQPAMLSGSLGYAVGTLAGLVVARMTGLPIAV